MIGILRWLWQILENFYDSIVAGYLADNREELYDDAEKRRKYEN